MSKIMSKNRGNFFAVSAIALATAAVIAGCGGGGGGGSVVVTPPTPVTFTETVSATCPNDAKVTGTATEATQAAAQSKALDNALAQCSGPTLTSITPANGSTTADPDGIATTGIVVSTSSALQIPNVTNDLVLKAGTTVVPVKVSPVDPKVLRITPTVKLLYGQLYSYVFNLKDGLGKPLTVSGSFITSASGCNLPSQLNSLGVCMAPPAPTGYTWNVANKVWVADIGTLVTGLNTLPAECVTIGDACWKVSSANGTIKYFGTGLTVDGRKFIFAGYIIGGTLPGAGSFAMKTIYFDTEAATPGLSKEVNVAYNTSGIVNAKGSVDGVKYTTPTNGCWEFFYTGSGTNTRPATCPI